MLPPQQPTPRYLNPTIVASIAALVLAGAAVLAVGIAIPLAIGLGITWACLGARPQLWVLPRWHAAVPLLLHGLLAYQGWWIVQQMSGPERAYTLGVFVSMAIGGLMLGLAIRGFRRLSQPELDLAIGATVASILILVAGLWTVWGVGIRDESLVLTIELSVYAGSFATAAFIPWLARGFYGIRIPVSTSFAPIVSITGVSIGTFFYPVEFFNSCMATTLLPYTLC